MSCDHTKTIMNTAIHCEFKGFSNKKGKILFINAGVKKEGIEYAVLFIDEKFLHRSESFFNRFSQIETFRYKGIECVYTSDSIAFNTTCYKRSKMNKELYLEKIDKKNVELSKIENGIGASYSPQIYIYRHWLEQPYGSDRIEL